MKRIVFLGLILFILVVKVSAFNPMVFKGEETVTVSTTAKLHTITTNGYLSVFSNGGTVFFTEDPDGVTPNANNKYITDGGEVDTGSYYFVGDKFGILANSGTVSVNFTSRDLLRR